MMATLAFNKLNNIRALLKSDLIDLDARNFVHGKTSLHARCVHTRHRACKLSSLDGGQHLTSILQLFSFGKLTNHFGKDQLIPVNFIMKK